MDFYDARDDHATIVRTMTACRSACVCALCLRVCVQGSECICMRTLDVMLLPLVTLQFDKPVWESPFLTENTALSYFKRSQFYGDNDRKFEFQVDKQYSAPPRVFVIKKLVCPYMR